ncbi:cytochrome c maturation protein CcmE [Salinisphaera sp. SPP-AMP-43]|uniref:cytochrome c maturation protein CcmE n=1 Tax=Salinisphaera sp. SPP-AMP-43 TaxID=3121288 RepID=UPI003C6E0C98
MTRTQRRRVWLVMSLLAGLAGALLLTLTAFRGNLLYFHQPSEIVAGRVPAHERIRLGGLVAAGSVRHRHASLTVQFQVADCDARVPVRFNGVLPDLFRPGQGVIVYGELDGHGVLIADRVLAKHDSRYMSPETAKALQPNEHSSCMPARLQSAAS